MSDEFFAWLTNVINKHCPIHENEPLEIVDLRTVDTGGCFYALGYCEECDSYYDLLFDIVKVYRLNSEEV